MYTVIRKYDVIPGTLEEFIQHVQESLVPILNRVPGCRAFYLLEVGDNEAAAISIFDTLADARGAAKQTAAWVAERAQRKERAILARSLPSGSSTGNRIPSNHL
jgi:heme-degrading monooxygenase HmoA